MTTLTRHLPSLHTSGFHNPFHRLAQRFRAWRAHRRAYARTMRELEQLDCRDLRDLGITRHDFEALARGSYRR